MSITMNARLAARSCAKLRPSCSAQTTSRHLSNLSSLKAPLPILDFLLPQSFHTRSPKSFSLRSFQEPARSARTFTTTVRRHTKVLFNPKKDEDGKDMSIEITGRASTRLKEIMSTDANPNLALRILVESGGCHGYQYFMSLTTLPPDLSAPSFTLPPPNLASDSTASAPAETDGKKEGLEEDDTVFVAEDGTDAKVVIDEVSLELLAGSKIDYTMALIGSQFKIVESPRASSSCGCGTSFDIKI